MVHPQTIARDMVLESGDYRGTGVPIKLSRTPGGFNKTPPAYGEDNKSILQNAGYSEEEINNFINMQIVLDKPHK